MQSQRHAMLATERTFLFWTVFIFLKNTVFVVVRNEYDFMASNSVYWKKNSLRIIDSNELTHHIGTYNVHIHFANFTVNQLIWYAVGWSGLALILIFNWYGIQLDFDPRLHSIQSIPFYNYWFSLLCIHIWETKVSIIKWAIIIWFHTFNEPLMLLNSLTTSHSVRILIPEPIVIV